MPFLSPSSPASSARGKTTLLNRILTEHHGKKLAVIENEFGEVGVDHQLSSPATRNCSR